MTKSTDPGEPAQEPAKPTRRAPKRPSPTRRSVPAANSATASAAGDEPVAVEPDAGTRNGSMPSASVPSSESATGSEPSEEAEPRAAEAPTTQVPVSEIAEDGAVDPAAASPVAENGSAAPSSNGTAADASQDSADTARGDQAATLPPPWQRVPASASTTGREAVGGVATAQSGAAAAVTRNTAGTGSVAAEDTGVPRETRNNLADARTDYLKAPPADPPTTQMRLPLSGTDSGDGDRPSGSGVPGGFPMSWPRNRRPRQAALQLKRLDPWSVLKIALVLAVVLYLVWLVAVGVLYGVLDGIGVWDRLNGQYADLVAEQSGERLISAGRVFGVAAVIGAVNSLLVAVAMSVGAFVYNVAADLVGGVEVTLSERD